MGLAAEVLPVVGILTLRFVVLFRQKRAPFSLEVEHVKVELFGVLVNKTRFYVDLRVCKGAKITVGTVLCIA